ncbi:MAG: N-acetylmuramoyl-L-alanine amidase CwlD [Oscillospiraceae bacterium]
MKILKNLNIPQDFFIVSDEVIFVFWVINKKWIGIICAVLLIITIGVCIFINFINDKPEKPTMALPTTNKTIVIDPGHGGVDAGASDNGLEEKEVNLSIALKLKEYIQQSGGVAILTREEDEGTHNNDRPNGVSQKQSDLEMRKNMAEEYSADAFVSIHMNKFPQAQYKGSQVFYANEPEQSRKLAESIQQALKDVLQDGNTREAKSNERNVLILKEVKVPSVIVECGFLSNPEEAELLKSDEYRDKIAWAIYIGIVKYFI